MTHSSRLPLIAGFLFGLLVAWAMSCGGGGSSGQAPPNIMDPSVWNVMTLTENYSPAPSKDGLVFDIPYPTADAGSVHYVTAPSGSLTGKTKVTLTGRWEMADGAKLVPRRFPDAPSLMTLYFQRNGDDWSAQGDKEAYRWYASFGTVQNVKPGEFVMTARFDQNWTAILRSSRANNPSGFNAAIDDAGRIGFVLGGGDGLGHGVYATGPTRLVVTDFKIE
jgi:hypothetical protein